MVSQDLLNNQEFIDRLVNYNSSLAYKMYEEIKYLNEMTNTVQDIEQNQKGLKNEVAS